MYYIWSICSEFFQTIITIVTSFCFCCLSGRFVTLCPGDVFLTGTPPGVGFFRNPPVFLKASSSLEKWDVYFNTAGLTPYHTITAPGNLLPPFTVGPDRWKHNESRSNLDRKHMTTSHGCGDVVIILVFTIIAKWRFLMVSKLTWVQTDLLNETQGHEANQTEEYRDVIKPLLFFISTSTLLFLASELNPELPGLFIVLIILLSWWKNPGSATVSNNIFLL